MPRCRTRCLQNYAGGAYLEAEVQRSFRITYRGRNTYSSSSDSASYDEDHNLYAHDSDSGYASSSFSFSPYQEVVAAEVAYARCKIDDVALW